MVTPATSFCDTGSKQEKLSGVTGVSKARRLCSQKTFFSGQGTRHPLETSAAHSRVLKILQRELPEFRKTKTVHGNSSKNPGTCPRKTGEIQVLARFSLRKHRFPMENYGFCPQNIVFLRETLRKHGFRKENLKKTWFS